MAVRGRTSSEVSVCIITAENSRLYLLRHLPPGGGHARLRDERRPFDLAALHLGGSGSKLDLVARGPLVPLRRVRGEMPLAELLTALFFSPATDGIPSS